MWAYRGSCTSVFNRRIAHRLVECLHTHQVQTDQLLALDTKSVNTTGQVWIVLLCQQLDCQVARGMRLEISGTNWCKPKKSSQFGWKIIFKPSECMHQKVMALACMCLCVCVSAYLLTLQRRHCSFIHPNSILNYLVLLSPCVHPIHTNDQNINDTMPRVHCTQGFALLCTELVVHRSGNETRKQEIAKPHSIYGTFVTCCLQMCYIKGTSTHCSGDFRFFIALAVVILSWMRKQLMWF